MTNPSEQTVSPVWFRPTARRATEEEIKNHREINGNWPRNELVSRIYTMLTKAVRHEPEEFTVLLPLYNEDTCNFDQFVFTFTPGAGEANSDFFDARVYAHPIFSNGARAIDDDGWRFDIDHLASFMSEEEYEKVLKVQSDYRIQNTFLKPRVEETDDADEVECTSEPCVLMNYVRRLIIKRKVWILMITLKKVAFPKRAVKRPRED